MSLRSTVDGHVLHARPYRETSLLLELFTREHGLLGAIARGVRSSRLRRDLPSARLQPFSQSLFVLHGRGDLRTVVRVEPEVNRYDLQGRNLYCGFYLNEIVMRLLVRMDPHPRLYDAYKLCMQALVLADDVQPVLRRFERLLVEAIGYGFSWSQTVPEGSPIRTECDYRFAPDCGFMTKSLSDAGPCFSGARILDIAAGRFENPETLRVAKRIMRMALNFHLGPRPLQSRQLFARVYSVN